MSTPQDSPPGSPPEPGTLRKPSHGHGFLLHGSKPGHPATGRPPSKIRQALAGVVDEDGVDFIRSVIRNEIADASVSDRVAAFDKAAKYSIGAVKGVDTEIVREKLSQTIAMLTELLGPVDAEPLIREMEAIWSGKTR